MNKMFFVVITGLALCSCTFETSPSKDYLSYSVTNENYETFFRTEVNSTYKEIRVEPFFKKHINYNSVVFTYKSTRYDESNFGVNTLPRNAVETFTVSINLDINGNGKNYFVRTDLDYPATYYSVEFISVEGTISFKEDYSVYKKMEDLKRDINHKENIGVYYNFSGSEKYKLIFKADYNVTETPETDAFFLIESVTVKFTAIVNNADKKCEIVFNPNLFGIAEMPINDEYTNISNVSYIYKNGYYLGY